MIRRVREELFARTQDCAVCGMPEFITRGFHPKSTHEMHEDPPRSKTRGRPPEERFNSRVCMRICPICHADYTAHRVKCEPLTSKGFAGPYRVLVKRQSEWVEIHRMDVCPK